jgi:hypothetical protein
MHNRSSALLRASSISEKQRVAIGGGAQPHGVPHRAAVSTALDHYLLAQRSAHLVGHAYLNVLQ